MKDQESLQSSAVIGELSNAIENDINNLLSRRVVTTRIVVCGVLLAIDNLLGVVELTVRAIAHFVADGGFEIHKDGAGDMTAGGSFGKEGVEGIIRNSDVLIRAKGSIGSNAMLQAIQLPALVSGLNTGLTQMNRDTL
jgi:hypothetical protein